MSCHCCSGVLAVIGPVPSKRGVPSGLVPLAPPSKPPPVPTPSLPLTPVPAVAPVLPPVAGAATVPVEPPVEAFEPL